MTVTKNKDSEFEPKYLYIEDYIIPPELLNKDKDEEDEEDERGVIIIDVL